MLDLIKTLINDYISELNKGIAIESEVIYGENKIEYALSNDDYMASISVLSDYTYDFFVVEIMSDRTFMIKTKQFDNLDALITEIKSSILSFSEIK
ncbi:hypothetical protein [Paenibacillus sp. NPDC058071]|uniref:hypothetical protein n=1 Tax=Paenibacillus sp. NPDC058071 TaxID=3346326 RepID=UPI0036DEC53B